MNYYKKMFENDLQATLNDNVISIADKQYLPVDILKLSGDDVYEESFNIWKSHHIKGCRSKANEILNIDDKNNDNFDELKSYFNANTIVPFIGAGMSCDSGFYLWERFLREKLYNTSISDPIDILVEKGFEHAAEVICKYITKASYAQLIGTHYGNSKRCENIRGTVNILTHIFKESNLLITTNYDYILEKLFPKYSVVTKLSLHDSLYKKHLIIKLHGTANQPDSIVLTTSEYDSLYNEARNKTALKAIFNNHNLLFLGCSLGRDRTTCFMKDIQQECMQEGLEYKRHYALLNKNNLSPSKVASIEHNLSKSSIFPIWYNTALYDHSESVEALLIELIEGEL